LNNRIFTIDVLRTVAIILMVIFHFLYDLKFFGYVDWDTPDGPGWRSFRHVILISFFICLGASLNLSYHQAINWKKFSKRLSQIVLSALAISIVSLFMVPQNYIYFGVLHFIAIASLLCILFANKPLLSLIIGIVIILVFNMDLVSGIWPFTYIRASLPRYSNDYVGLFPWLGFVFIGIWLASTSFLKNDPLKSMSRYQWLASPGKHSLVIYLVHQPFFFAIFGLIAFIQSA
jgi:uncharacterized membrane protein